MSVHHSLLKRKALLRERPILERLECRTLMSAGTPDPTFGTDGSVATFFSNAPGRFENSAAVLFQHNGGSIVLADFDFTDEFGLTRVTADGTVDPSFGTNGQTYADFGEPSSPATGAALQVDGDIVVVGSAGSSQQEFALARFNSAGDLDTNFGNHGDVITNVGGDASANAVAIDSQGRIIVAGVSHITDNGDTQTSDLTLARYLPNGTLDQTFGHDGIDVFATGPAASAVANALTLQSNGEIVVAGTQGGQFFAARLTSSGALDSTFGAGGVRRINFKAPASAIGVAVVAGGKIVLGGTKTSSAGYSRFALARLDSNGAIDTTFGANGITAPAFAYSSTAVAMAVQPDGSILLAGFSGGGITFYSSVARFTANGALDSTFNHNGQIFYDLDSDGFTGAGAIALQSDGGILVGGFADLTRFLGDPPASVSGTVFNDANGNGVLNPGEAGLSSVRIFLDLNENGVFDPGIDYYVTSDAEGHYTFANLAPGTYQFREVIPAGMHITAPAGDVFTLTLTAGENLTGKNFGNKT